MKCQPADEWICCCDDVTCRAAAGAAAAGAKATVKPSLAEEPNVSVDPTSKKMIIKFATVSSTEPTLAWTFGGKAINLSGGQYSMSKVVKDGQYFYTFEISQVQPLYSRLVCSCFDLTGSAAKNNKQQDITSSFYTTIILLNLLYKSSAHRQRCKLSNHEIAHGHVVSWNLRRYCLTDISKTVEYAQNNELK